MLKRIVEAAAGRIVVVAGAGINATNCSDLIKFSKVKVFVMNIREPFYLGTFIFGVYYS